MDLVQHGQDSAPAPSAFLDLPVEIRLAIYEISIRDGIEAEEFAIHDVVDRHPTPPGIMQACRITRSESASIWYGKARFPVKFRALGPHESKQPPGSTAEYDMIIDRPLPTYRMMRRLRLCFTGSYGMNARYFCYSVNLYERNNSYAVEHTPQTHEWWVGYRPWNVNAHKKAERRARCLRKRFDIAVAEMIAESDGVKALTVESYERLTPRPEWRFGDDLPEDLEV